MRLLSTLLTALSLLFPLVPAALIISLPTTHVGLPSSDHASLAALSSHLTAPLTRQSTFSFTSSSLKPSTSYLLDIHSRVYNFASYRVDVDASGQVEGVWETFRGGEWGNKGPDVMVKGEEGGDTRVEVRFVGKREYYEGRGSFSPLSMLKSPIVLLGIVGLGFAVGMPYILDNMDPETREEFQKQQAKSPLAGGMSGLAQTATGGGGGAASAAKNFDLAGWMAGSSSGGTTASGRDTGAARRRG